MLWQGRRMKNYQVSLLEADPIDAIKLIPDVTEWRLVRGTKGTVDCVALGNPDPTTMWEFFPETSQNSSLS
ncbi:Hypothetical predicted protein [Octopus vulgaris]|uniref:Uncharacterized protein n=1 Tax=Octopus vulgaris TaxID=6645 RepID=A0AA36BMM4_OCTVU|nr:Hypothetical predicted protein [Octopus vulgaris]